MDDPPLSFLAGPLPPAFALRSVAVAPGRDHAFDEAEWSDALVVVERGEIELEFMGASRHTCTRGDVLSLSGLPLRALHNPGREPALLVAVTRVCCSPVTEAAVIGAPTSLGAFAPGQEQAPRALREAGLVERLRADDVDVADLGDIALRRWQPDREQRRAQNATGVAQAATEVADKVEAAVRAGQLALVLGGDCTVELGVVSGALRAGLERVGLVYFDMHPDLNTPDTVETGTLDWMGSAHMLALPGTHPAVAGIGPRTPLLAPADLVLFAAAPDQTKPGEQRAIEQHGVHVTPLPEVAADPRAAAERTLALVRDRFDHYLLHFDVDTVDFVDLPLSENTGHNIGLSFEAATAALEVLAADRRLAALTVTEHNPVHGAEDGSTTAALASALAAAVRYRIAA